LNSTFKYAIVILNPIAVLPASGLQAGILLYPDIFTKARRSDWRAFFVDEHQTKARCAMAVITISRQFGSGGDEIAEKICANSGYRLFDKHLLMKAALDAGISNQQIIDYSDNNIKVDNFFDRLFGRPAPAAQIRFTTQDFDGHQIIELKNLNEEQAHTLLVKAVETAYELGNFLILGRGGQVILQDKREVLHVRVEAPLEDRLIRVRSQLQQAHMTFATSLEARRAAQDLIIENDAASGDYVKHMFGVDWSDHTLYDIILNTRRLDLDLAARQILELAQQMSEMPEPA
jgi:CMP/dCMP kinase